MSLRLPPPAAWLSLILVGALAVDPSPAANDRTQRSGPPRFVARLLAIHEVPAIASPARGAVTVTIDDAARMISYELRYERIDTTVLQAHLHLGQPGVNGGIMVWLCGSVALPGPAGTPGCAASPGSVSGQVSADQVVGPAGQGISPGEFAEVARVIRDGVVYANVHTTKHPSGEIRGTLRPAWAGPTETHEGGSGADDGGTGAGAGVGAPAGPRALQPGDQPTAAAAQSSRNVAA